MPFSFWWDQIFWLKQFLTKAFLDKYFLGQMKTIFKRQPFIFRKNSKTLAIKNRHSKNSSTGVLVIKKFPIFLGNIIKETKVTLVKHAVHPEKFV